MASLAPQDISGSGSQEHKREDDGIREALEKVTATMYSISSKAGTELGPVLTAEVLLEGEAVEALLVPCDYCVTRVSGASVSQETTSQPTTKRVEEACGKAVGTNPGGST